MIVVDTNVIVYAALPGARTADALALAERDAAWVAPALWRREFRNVRAALMRALAQAFPGRVIPLEDLIAGL